MVSRVLGEEVASVNSETVDVRHSRVAYVVAKLKVRGQEYVLLNAHRKWGDWSLPGGHVEPTDHDSWAAAARETSEELSPLRYGEDVEVKPDLLARSEWGPVPSSSASGARTIYQATFYVLEFKASPQACLARLPRDDFRLVRLSDLADSPNISKVVQHLPQLLPAGWSSLPLAWKDDLDDAPLRASASNHPLPAE
jgi:8-oxo-dGTP pyrophosphatase MutT (NUDIX family)